MSVSPQRKKSDWKPTASDFECLPFLKALAPLKQKLPPELTAALLEEYTVKKIVKGIKDADTYLSAQIRDRETQAVEVATRVVSRHYRRVSVSVHPDRHGNDFEDEFDTLKTAYDVLSDPEMRCDYFQKMLMVVEKLGPLSPLIMNAHLTWLESRERHQEGQTDWARYATTTKKTSRNLYLDAALSEQTARVVTVVKNTSPDSRLLHLGLPPLRPYQSFKDCCTAIYVFAEDSGKDILLAKLKGKKLKDAFEAGTTYMIPVDVTLPEYGIWSVYWYASLEVGGTARNTPPSAPRQFNRTHPAVRRALQEKPALLCQAKRLTGSLRSTLGHLKWSSHQTRTNLEDIERQYWSLHQTISKGRTLQQRLLTTLETLSDDPAACQELALLSEAVDDATIEKSKVDDVIFANKKKESLKAFKQSIASLIEGGTVTEWILHVSKEEITNTGGEVNRLYQLLVEGKKANSLALDSIALSNAAKRTDLFTPKQCETLLKRSSEVEAQMIAETERHIKEEEERKAAEKKRREMEQRAQLMPLRTTVEIHSLKNKSTELNGSLGIYMGLAENNRYAVRILGTGRDVALLASNFKRWEDKPSFREPTEQNVEETITPEGVSHSSSPWYCAHCSFLHDGTLAGAKNCKVCNKPRGPAPGSFAAASESMLQPTENIPSSIANQLPSVSKDTPLTKQEAADPTKNTMRIRLIDVPVFIGKKGKNIKQLQEESGATITVDSRPKYVTQDKTCPVRIKGKPEAVQKATNMVDDFIQERAVGGKGTHPQPSKASQGSSGVHQTAQHSMPSVATLVPESAPSKTENKMAPSSQNVSPVENTDSLQLFLCEHKAFLKCGPDAFYQWLQSEDISTLDDLVEAVQDEDFLREMQTKGLKGFKKAAFKKAVTGATQGGTNAIEFSAPQSNVDIPIVANGLDSETEEPPTELVCPISHVLMVKDPVLARDGYTYERAAIESWFARQADAGGARSPMINVLLDDLSLVPNASIRTMARDFAQANPSAML